MSYAIVCRSNASQAPLAGATWTAGWVTNDGTEYTVAVPATSTASLVAGRWEITEYRTLSTARHTTLARQPLIVQPNLALATAGSDVFHPEKMLGLVEAELAARLGGTAGSAHDSYQIGGRAINKLSVKELRQYRAMLKAEIVQNATGQIGRTVEFQFGPTSPAGASQWE